jgi:hypothetical protein
MFEADRHVAPDIVTDASVGRDGIEPHGSDCARSIQADGQLRLREAAKAPGKIGALTPARQSRADKKILRDTIVDPGGQHGRRSGLIEKTGVFARAQAADITADPRVEAERTTLRLRQPDLVLNCADQPGTRFQRRFGEHRDHARGDDQAVFVIGKHLLSGCR